jgi:transposase
MLRIEQIADLGTCQHVALLLEKECASLLTRNRELAREVARLKGSDQLVADLGEVERLEVQLAPLQRMVFGTSSERRPQDGEAEAPAVAKPRTGHGPTPQPRLPVVTVPHRLTPQQLPTCERCERVVEAWEGQTEDAELITVVQRAFKVERHERQKYRCACGDTLATAPGPVRLIEGGRYSTEFAIEVCADKYLDHQPLDRQRKTMGREGLDVTTAALWDQVHAVAEVLRPTHQALKELVLSSPLVHADETRWMLLTSPESERWQAWGIASPQAVCYEILPSRSAEAGSTLLAGYRGTLLVDGYAAYPAIARGSPGLRLAHCMAHSRRKFVEVEKFYPAECKVVLDLIGKLYAVERAAPPFARLEGAERANALEIRLAMRQEQSRPLMDQIRTWALGLQVPRESVLRKAVEYMLERWEGLTRFLEDPIVPLDNNLLERSLRPIALGRKNHLGSKSPRGAQATAVLYSVLETAKLAGVDPRAYLTAAVHGALEVPFRVVLPHEVDVPYAA